MATLNINLKNIEHNLEEIKKVLNSTTEVLAMVKANAYGLGDVEISKFLESKGVKFFGVAYVKEGINLRKNGILSNIFVTTPFLENDIESIIDYNLTISISNLELLKKLNDYALMRNAKVKAHIKIETGMSRFGFKLDELSDALKQIENYTSIIIEGVYTHLSSADSDKDYTLKQIEKFKEAVKIINSANIAPKYYHCLSSAGIVNFTEFQFNMVRPGDILYGYHPDESIRNKIKIIPSAKLEAKVLNITSYPQGTKIGYNETYTLERDSKVAIIGIGYADGLFRNLSNKYSININGVKCKIIGNICMDVFMCDVTDVESIKLFDDVVIFGYNDDIYNMADISNTIDYEILSKITNRVERKYID